MADVRVANRVLDDLIGQLRALRLLKSKARRLADEFLQRLQQDVPRVRNVDGAAHEAEQILFRMQGIVQRLSDRDEDPARFVLHMVEARLNVVALDTLETELWTVALGEAPPELAAAQERDFLQDRRDDWMLMDQTLEEALADDDFRAAAEAANSALDAVPIVDRDAQLSQPRSPLARALQEMSNTVRRTLQRRQATIGPDVLKVHKQVELGNGSFGLVVTGTLEGKPVAVKCCRIVAGQDEDLLRGQDALLREAEVWKLLRHRNIAHLRGVAVLEEQMELPNGVSLTQERLFLVMERCDTSLDKVLYGPDHDALTSDERMTIMKGIARGVMYLHTNNVLHRDLKPSNVLLRYERHMDSANVKLSDFGLSVLKDPGVTRAGVFNVEGSVPYQAPETLDAPAKWTPRADVYAMGVTFYAILERVKPWSGHDVFQIRDKVRAGERPAWSPVVGQHGDPPWRRDVKKQVAMAWKQRAHDRPTVPQILEKLENRVHDRRSTRVMQHMLKMFLPLMRNTSNQAEHQAPPEASDLVRLSSNIAQVSVPRRRSIKRDAGFPGNARVGQLVRIRDAVDPPARGWQGCSHESVGYIVELHGEEVGVDFPELNVPFETRRSELELVDASHLAEPLGEGDFVRLVEGADAQDGVLLNGAVGFVATFDSGSVPYLVQPVDPKSGRPEKDASGFWYTRAALVKVSPPVPRDPHALAKGVVVRLKKGIRAGCLNRGTGRGVIVRDDRSPITPFQVALLDGVGDPTDQTFWYGEGQLVAVATAEAQQRRLQQDDVVQLATEVPLGVLDMHDVGLIVDDYFDGMPYLVKKLNRRTKETEGDGHFYTRAQLVLASDEDASEFEEAAAQQQQRPTAGDFVRLRAGQTGGCLGSRGPLGVIVVDDNSRVPFRVAPVREDGAFNMGNTWYYSEARVERVEATHLPEGAFAFENGLPNRQLRVGARVQAKDLQQRGRVLGWMFQKVRFGNTDGGLRSDGFLRMAPDNGNAPYNIRGSTARLL